MGLSVYTDRDRAIQCAGRYRNLGKNIARLTLTHVAGKALETPGQFPSHHTWWKTEDFDPTKVAQVMQSLLQPEKDLLCCLI